MPRSREKSRGDWVGHRLWHPLLLLVSDSLSPRLILGGVLGSPLPLVVVVVGLGDG